MDNADRSRDRRHCVCGHHVGDHSPGGTMHCEAETPQPCDCQKWKPCHNSILAAALREMEEELHKWQDKATERQEQLAFLVGEKKTLATRLARVEASARRLLNELPDWSLERMRDGIGNSNVACIRQRRDELAAMTPDATTEK